MGDSRQDQKCLTDWHNHFKRHGCRLYWKHDVTSGRNGTVIKAFKGDEAGSINNRGYWCIKLHGKIYKRSRVIYEMIHGVRLSTKDVIDHIDQDKLNDDPENLRLCTQSVNNKNASMRKDNSSGVTGVSWSAKRNRWIAQIQHNGKSKLRTFTDFVSACEQRIEWEVSLKFSINHGRKR